MQVCRSLRDKVVTSLLQATVSIPYQSQVCVQIVNKNVTRLSLGLHKVVDKIVTRLSLLYEIYIYTILSRQYHGIMHVCYLVYRDEGCMSYIMPSSCGT